MKKEHPFTKAERIKGEKSTQLLFDHDAGAQSLVAFPLRALFCLAPAAPGSAPAQLLISVPKKRMRHAIERNRIKRQVRESYRLNRHLLYPATQSYPDERLLVGVIYIDGKLHPTAQIERSMQQILKKIPGKLSQQPATEE